MKRKGMLVRVANPGEDSVKWAGERNLKLDKLVLRLKERAIENGRDGERRWICTYVKWNPDVLFRGYYNLGQVPEIVYFDDYELTPVYSSLFDVEEA